jgi:hypothetical protein
MKRFELSELKASNAKRVKSASHKCRFCDEKFSRLDNAKRHECTCVNNPNAGEIINGKRCVYCDKAFNRNDVLKKHVEWHKTMLPTSSSAMNMKKSYKCAFCNTDLSRMYSKHRHEEKCIANPKRKEVNNLQKHLKDHSREQQSSSPTLPALTPSTSMPSTSKLQSLPPPPPSQSLSDESNVIVTAQAFGSRVREILVKNEKDLLSPDQFLESKRAVLSNLLQKSLEEHRSIKFYMSLICLYTKHTEINESGIIEQQFIHHTKMVTVLMDFEIEETLSSRFKCLTTRMEEFQERDSGWALSKICHLEVKINKNVPIGGEKFIDLPKFIKLKKAVINIQNHDNRCFEYAVNACINPVENGKNPCLVSSYRTNENSTKLIFDNISFPMKLNDISKFERMNPTISINVFGVEKKSIVGPLYHTSQRKSKHVNLLLIKKGENSHYCWIKNMSR